MKGTELQKSEGREVAEVATPPEVTYVPDVDIWEGEDAFAIVADMPGVDEKSVDIDLDKNVLTIRGRSVLVNPAGFSCTYQEYRTGNYERQFTLGTEIDRGGVTATAKNGVLRLVLPKVKEAKPRKIAVQLS